MAGNDNAICESGHRERRSTTIIERGGQRYTEDFGLENADIAGGMCIEELHADNNLFGGRC